MGRFRKLIVQFNRRLIESWRKYAEFVHGEEIKSFTKEAALSTWNMKSTLPPQTKKLALRDFAEVYTHGFQFVRKHDEYELTHVFSKGEIFRPEKRCRVDRDLVSHVESGKVYHLPDPAAWLTALGFDDFDEAGQAAYRVSGDNGIVWVVLDSRPEVFARPLIEEIVRRREVEQ